MKTSKLAITQVAHPLVLVSRGFLWFSVGSWIPFAHPLPSSLLTMLGFPRYTHTYIDQKPKLMKTIGTKILFNHYYLCERVPEQHY